MAKDPAFLFYTSDFLTGTMFFSNEQVGIYIRLLCAQHQHGAMIEEKAFNSLVKDDELLRSKFHKCDGGYYNERLLHEMSLRNKKSTNISSAMKDVWDKRKKESQKKGIESYNNPNNKQSKKHEKLIEIEDEDENEDEFENTEKGGTGEKTIIGEVVELWQQSGLVYGVDEAKDIRELCEKILNIKDVAQADELKRHELLGIMEKIISWVKSENNIKYYGSLKSINNNFSKIINAIKNNGKSTKQTKRTGEGSSPDELAEVVRRRFSNQPQV